jgi:hypothetical protein
MEYQLETYIANGMNRYANLMLLNAYIVLVVSEMVITLITQTCTYKSTNYEESNVSR